MTFFRAKLWQFSRRFVSTSDRESRSLIPSLRVPWMHHNYIQTSVAIDFIQNDFASYNTNVSTKEGLHIASERVAGGFSTLGVAIEAGPRHEKRFPLGICHFLTKLAFGPTINYPNRADVLNVLEQSGAIFDCQISHDIIMYAVSCRTDQINKMLDLLSDCILKPIINEEEIENAKKSIVGELDDLVMKPDPSPILNEILHKAAFNDTLGYSQFCKIENLNKIGINDFDKYMSTFYRKERMVICCVGNVDHDQFSDDVCKYFLKKEFTVVNTNTETDAKAEWTGSSIMVERDLSNVSLGPTPMPELLHLSIGFKAPSYNDPDCVAACVLQSLMGGGGSFSSGGPGKGMYSRLYLRVLNHFGWMYSAVCTYTGYKDAGLFSINTSCYPSYARQMVDVSIREILAVTDKIGEKEMQRAKNQLKSSILMNLEQRSVAFEDISRQVIGTGRRRNPIEFSQMIDDVTEKDIHQLVIKMLSNTPAIAAFGAVNKLPNHQYFISRLTPPNFLRRMFS